MSSLEVGVQADVNSRVSALRSIEVPSAEIGSPIFEGVTINQDPDEPRPAALSSSSGQVFRFSAPENVATKWTTANLVLGPIDLSDVEVLGIVIKTQSMEDALACRVAIRSGVGSRFKDTFFKKHVVSTADKGVHLDLLELHKETSLPKLADWRDLVVFLPNKKIDLVVHDVRFFAV